LVATELQTLHEKSRAQAADLESKERQAEALGHAAEDRDREVGRLTARLTGRESELEAQREIRKDLEARLTDALARLGKTEDLVEEARMLESQRMEAPAEASDEPPVHHDPEAERHIAWLQTELIRANRDGDRRLEDLTATLRRAEQQLESVGQRERALQEQLRSRGEPGAEGVDAQDNPDKATPGRRLRPPRW
jgi:chromosome segregation ATPase